MATLGDFISLQRGKTYKSALLDSPGPYLLGLGSIARDGGFRGEKLRTYGGDSPEALLLRPGDLYVSLKDVTQSGDLLGSVARVPDSIALGRLTQDTVKLKLNANAPDSRFLYWVMRTPEYRAHCRGHATGTTNLGLARDDFLAFTIPELTEVRKYLVTALEGVERKIEQNRRTSRGLEGFARAVFKAWFVDFEPMKAKAAGATTFPGMLPETFATLPAQLVDSELGPVPQGWNVKPLSACISRLLDHRGKTPKKLGGDWSSVGGTPALSAKNVKAGRIIRSELNNFVDDAMFRRWMPEPLELNDIVMTSEAPLGELTYLARNADYCLSQRVFGIRADTDVIEPSILHRFLESDGGQSQLVNRATGTTVVGIRQSELRKLEVPIPPILIQRAASAVLQPIAEEISQIEETSEKLAALRDFLLPRLLSGRVRVFERRI